MRWCQFLALLLRVLFIRERCVIVARAVGAERGIFSSKHVIIASPLERSVALVADGCHLASSKHERDDNSECDCDVRE